ncbi:sensor histidine kinase [Sinomicrobium weinanense]|uniref:histidine kinase n=1 Tax=Sinomicrobium weinanense TaxID=2842200 RepID=A0A926JU44_9FLAO|nr:HAMP domain-containing sensor histidine kinase [Sinomicrobium weinanense]MBC9797563.1 HAMP domain-containing histidine kinase [Sinomicrobium weinanense]MBU3123918.1 HAMP domain-containing histidine kinase [Sinomicrobium weinanense]
MTPVKQKSIAKWILIGMSVLVVSLILWNTYAFFQRFKEEERIKMKIWAAAQAEILQTSDLERDLGALPLEVLTNNTSTPMILVNVNGISTPSNMSEKIVKDPEKIQQKIKEFARENEPIEINFKNEKLATLYYGNSEVLTKLKYYPIALILIILLFIAVILLFYRTSKISDQNKLWAGMAKETAHQIGTPLSSLVGWAEILKSQNTDPAIITEIEKDIFRLQTITDRFSKIGSVPVLTTLNIIGETKNAYDYLKERSSKLITFDFIAPDYPIMAKINPQLFSWTIENLVKNAIDAMKGKGDLRIEIRDGGRHVNLLVTDTGKGIPKNHYKTIFNPGFTTKRRGWGLGLSLVQRIIEDYHEGKVKVLHSDIGKGTTMQITLKVTS